jgi:putative SOS response-associated peptidase YedK
MCGRYVIISAPEVIGALFGCEETPDFPPRYNVAPTEPVPIVRQERERRHFALVRWGLIPSWVKDPRAFPLLINVRGESVLDKPAFRAAMRYRRCLFPADGFYEWRREGKSRVPFFVRPRRDGPIAFAGLWETWSGPNGEELESAAIVTTQANRTLAAIHERMPVVVPREAFDLWLDPAVDAKAAAAVLAPAPDSLFEAYEISPAVNRAGHDGPQLIAPAMSHPSSATRDAAPSASAAPERRRKPKKKDTRQPSLF